MGVDEVFFVVPSDSVRVCKFISLMITLLVSSSIVSSKSHKLANLVIFIKDVCIKVIKT